MQGPYLKKKDTTHIPFYYWEVDVEIIKGIEPTGPSPEAVPLAWRMEAEELFDYL